MNKELFNKIINCKNVEDIINLAKDNNVKLTKENALKVLNKIQKNEGKISEEELRSVSGGSGCSNKNPYEHKEWEHQGEVQYVARVGQTVERYKRNTTSTETVKIIMLKTQSYKKDGKAYYYDVYIDDTGYTFEREKIVSIS